MPRRSSSPSLPQKKMTSLPLVVDYKKNLPAVIVPQRPSFLQTIKEGVGLGLGSSIGHRIVGSILGPTNTAVPSINTEYEQCMKENDKSACEYLLRT
jgi:hypothetical protein